MTDLLPLSDDEAALLVHVERHGQDGYPIAKRRREWWVESYRTVPGFPCPFQTRKAARAAFEGWLRLAAERLAAMQTPEELVMVTGAGIRRIPR